MPRVGRLSAAVNVSNMNNPVIKVRTWQKERDPDFGLYGPEHFK